ncbi:MAG: hypothetical protein FWC19_01020 [Treponema sp.]|nr:hypothetical protein [Treponema sp.]MCL2271374.1 hypothetical protein [Treponema sp.]
MNKRLTGKILAVLSLLFIFMLTSCIGISMDIVLHKDGSARVSMVYRVSGMAEMIGKLDGNENRPIIPAGREDFERTAARITGMKIVLFSTSVKNRDSITNVVLDFDNPQALLKFLDPKGETASINNDNFKIILNKPTAAEINKDLLDLMRENSEGYNFEFNFTADGKTSSMFITDGTGKQINPPDFANTVLSGKKVSLSMPVVPLYSLRDGFGVSVAWQ